MSAAAPEPTMGQAKIGKKAATPRVVLISHIEGECLVDFDGELLVINARVLERLVRASVVCCGCGRCDGALP